MTYSQSVQYVSVAVLRDLWYAAKQKNAPLLVDEESAGAAALNFPNNSNISFSLPRSPSAPAGTSIFSATADPTTPATPVLLLATIPTNSTTLPASLAQRPVVPLSPRSNSSGASSSSMSKSSSFPGASAGDELLLEDASTDILVADNKKKILVADFGKLLGQVVSEDHSNLGGEQGAKPKVLNEVDVFAIGLNWPGTALTHKDVEAIIDILSPVINFNDIFELVNRGMTLDPEIERKKRKEKDKSKSDSGDSNKEHSSKERTEKKVKHYMLLRGMICYYGSHYIAFIYNPDIMEWTLMDDNVVKIIGNDWGDLMVKCRTGQYRPNLLFYQRCRKEVAKCEREKFMEMKRNEAKTGKKVNPFINLGDAGPNPSIDIEVASNLQSHFNLEGDHLSKDEELAKALQEQFDLEVQESAAATAATVQLGNPTAPGSAIIGNTIVENPMMNQAAVANAGPNLRSQTIQDQRITGFLRQVDVESRYGFKQGHMLVRFRPVISMVFVGKPKERVAFIFQTIFCCYHPTKPIVLQRPDICIDLSKGSSLVHVENAKEWIWRLKVPKESMVYEFTVGDEQTMKSWKDHFERAITGVENDSRVHKSGNGFILDGVKVELRDEKERENFLKTFVKTQDCPCGSPAVFTCTCQNVGFCSKNCEIIHAKVHQPVCVKEAVLAAVAPDQLNS